MFPNSALLDIGFDLAFLHARWLVRIYSVSIRSQCISVPQQHDSYQ
jgi:hypothetical protein